MGGARAKAAGSSCRHEVDARSCTGARSLEPADISRRAVGAVALVGAASCTRVQATRCASSSYRLLSASWAASIAVWQSTRKARSAALGQALSAAALRGAAPGAR